MSESVKTTDRRDSDLGNRISGFLERMADHDLDVRAQTDEGGRMTFGVYFVQGGVDHLIATAANATEIEGLVEMWNKEGWPTAPSEDPSEEYSGYHPSWAKELIASGHVVGQGNGTYPDLNDSGVTMTEAVRESMLKLRKATTEDITRDLIQRFPKSVFNYKSVSAAISPLRDAGEVRRIGRGKYRYVGPVPTSEAQPQVEPQGGSRPEVEPEGSFTLLELLEMGTDWRIVGRTEAGTEVYTTGNTGELYVIDVNFQRL